MLNAYVLHRILYRETSLIVKFFTKEHGIVNLVARGVRRKKNPLAAILQPFVPLLIHWKQHNSDLSTLYKAEANGVPHKLMGIFLFGSLYINELLLKLLAPQDPHVELFDFYNQFLATIETFHNQDQVALEKHLRFMEKKILKAIGYELQLDRESHTGIDVDLKEKYYFDFENGLQKCKEEEISQVPVFSGSSLLALNNDNFTNVNEIREAKLFMRYILSNFLGKQSLATKKLFT